MGLFVVIVCFCLAALFLEALYRLALAALIWAPPLFCAVWAMQATAALHLADPLASLQAFLVGGLVCRFAMGRILDAIARWLD